MLSSEGQDLKWPLVGARSKCLEGAERGWLGGGGQLAGEADLRIVSALMLRLTKQCDSLGGTVQVYNSMIF